jgi:alpha,alpha-trehalase
MKIKQQDIVGSYTIRNNGRVLYHTLNEIRLGSIFLVAFLTIFFVSCSPHATSGRTCFSEKDSYIYSPSSDLEELFADVQMAAIFPDSKTFADCIPLVLPDSVLLLYRAQNHEPEFDLVRFVSHYFDCPETNRTVITHAANEDIVTHLNKTWKILERKPERTSEFSSLLPLSYPYIVPGGRFREIYYWDSYFTMEGLASSGRMDMVRYMLENFACLIEQYSFIPNGNRSYYLSRSQPPFFAEMVNLYMREKGDSAGLKYLPALEKEYAFWMRNNNPASSQHVIQIDDCILNRYWDRLAEPRSEAYREDVNLAKKFPADQRTDLYQNLRSACESGWDFSSRWLADPDDLTSIHTTEILPVDLNCLLYNLENMLAKLYKLNGQYKESIEFREKAVNRNKAINMYFWNEKEGFYFDYDFQKEEQTGIVSAAAVYPLYFGIADSVKAHRVAEKIRRELLKPGGLVTTTKHTGQQWDAPNGWAPLQWLAICGLENYGETGLAHEIAKRWMELNKKVYNETGRMMEKYSVEDLSLIAGGGEYPTQDGFGWTNGVFLALKKKNYP